MALKEENEMLKAELVRVYRQMRSEGRSIEGMRFAHLLQVGAADTPLPPTRHCTQDYAMKVACTSCPLTVLGPHVPMYDRSERVDRTELESKLRLNEEQTRKSKVRLTCLPLLRRP